MTTSVITMTVTRIAVWKLTGTKQNPRMLLHVLAAITTGLFLAWFSTILTVNEIYGVVLYAVMAYLVFEGLMYLMRELTRKDVAYLMDLFSVREMLSYVRTELRGKKQ
jgi:hypothetical protein